MNLTNEQIYGVVNGLSLLSDERLPARTAWKILTAKTTLTPFFESLQKTLDEARMRHAVRDEDGNLVPGLDTNGNPVQGTIQINPDSISALNQEIRDLLNVQVEVSNVSLSMNDLPESLEIAANALAALQPILVD